jgi:hypothetical protein
MPVPAFIGAVLFAKGSYAAYRFIQNDGSISATGRALAKDIASVHAFGIDTVRFVQTSIGLNGLAESYKDLGTFIRKVAGTKSFLDRLPSGVRNFLNEDGRLSTRLEEETRQALAHHAAMLALSETGTVTQRLRNRYLSTYLAGRLGSIIQSGLRERLKYELVGFHKKRNHKTDVVLAHELELPGMPAFDKLLTNLTRHPTLKRLHVDPKFIIEGLFPGSIHGVETLQTEPILDEAIERFAKS